MNDNNKYEAIPPSEYSFTENDDGTFTLTVGRPTLLGILSAIVGQHDDLRPAASAMTSLERAIGSVGTSMFSSDASMVFDIISKEDAEYLVNTVSQIAFDTCEGESTRH